MDAELSRFYYNKTACNDGITHVVNDPTQYMGIKVVITENYFTDDEEVILENIIRDLERMKQEFLKIKESRKVKEQEASDNISDFDMTQDLEK